MADFLTGYLGGQQAAQGAFQDEISKRNAIAVAMANRDAQQKAADQQIAKALGLLPQFQAGDQGAQMQLAAMGLAKPIESPQDQALREAKEAESKRRFEAEFGLSQQGLELRKEQDLKATEQFEKEFGLRKEETEIRRGERQEAKEMRAREEGRSEESLKMQREAAGRAAEAHTARMEEKTKEDKRQADLERMAELARQGNWGKIVEEFPDRVSQFSNVSEFSKFMRGEGYKGDLGKQVTEAEQKAKLSEAKQQAKALSGATGAREEDVLRDMLGVEKTKQTEAAQRKRRVAAIEYKARWNDVAQDPAKSKAFVADLLRKAKLGDDAAADVLDEIYR